MGGLIGTATTEKDGLMSKIFAPIYIQANNLRGKNWRVRNRGTYILTYSHPYANAVFLVYQAEGYDIKIQNLYKYGNGGEFRILSSGEYIVIKGVSAGGSVLGITNIGCSENKIEETNENIDGYTYIF